MKTDSPYLDTEIGATLGFCCTVATVKRDNIIKAKSPVVSLQIQVLSWSCDFFPGRGDEDWGCISWSGKLCVPAQLTTDGGMTSEESGKLTNALSKPAVGTHVHVCI